MAWPTSIATNTDLYLAANLKKTTLNGAITNVQTTITLTSTSGLPTKGIALIVTPNADPTLGELVQYTGISGSDITGCTRGFGGTAAAAHASADDVFLVVAAEHHNVLKDEIIAIEESLDFTSDRVVITDGSGRLTTSAVTSGDLGGATTVRKLSGSVDAETPAIYSLGIIPTGGPFAGIAVTVYGDTLTNVVTPAEISVGTNAPNYNNIIQQTPVTADQGDYQLITPTTNVAPLAGETLYSRVWVPATNGSPTTTDFTSSVNARLQDGTAANTTALAPPTDFSITTAGIFGANGPERGLLKFSSITLPMGHVLVSASLQLTIGGSTLPLADFTVNVHRVKRDWNTTSFVNWNRYDNGLNWSTPGAYDTNDIDLTPTALMELTSSSTGVVSFDVTADVSNFVNSVYPNYGWLIRSPEYEPETGRQFFFEGSAASLSANRPKLVVVSQLPGVVSTLTVTTVGHIIS